MSRPEDNRPEDEMRETMARLERELARTQQPPMTGVEPAPGGPSYMAPQPVRLRLPLSRPIAVYVLLAINVVMFGLSRLLVMLTGESFSGVLYLLGAKYGPAIDAGQYWRFLTPIMLHGGLLHLAFNSYALYSLGPEAERVYGTGRFLAIYLMAGLAGSIASYMLSPGLSIGASGAIFGLIGALAAFFYSARSLLGAEASRQQITQLVTMAAINIFLGFSVPTIDNAAHIGGLVAGTVAGFVMAPRYAIDDRLYPPAVVRRDRGSVSWIAGGVVLLVLVVLAAGTVALKRGPVPGS